MKSGQVTFEQQLDASLEEVWKAITEPEQMKHWYFDIKAFSPEIGFEFSFVGGSDEKPYVHLCRITEIESGKRIAYSWRYEGIPGITHVTFDLSPDKGGTRLKLTHEGLNSFPSNNPDVSAENFALGWQHIIGVSLKKFLEKRMIRKSVQVNAPVAQVWKVLIDPIYTKQWGNAFHEGTYVQTDWTIGSEVLWRDKEGGVGAKGIVVENDSRSLLKVTFFDEVDSSSEIPLGEYSETYQLSEDQEGTMLLLEAGPLGKEEIDLHTSLWEKAIMKIKALAEE